MSGDQAPLFDLADEIQNLLRPADGKGGNDHVAAPVQDFLNPRGKLADIVDALGTVYPVSVGRLDHQIVGVRHMLRILQDRLVKVADITAEADFFRPSVLMQPNLDGGRAKQMSDVCQANADGIVDLNHASVRTGTELLQNAVGVLGIKERFHLSIAAAFALAASPFGLGFLNVGRVTQHDLAQGECCRTGIDRAAVSLFI